MIRLGSGLVVLAAVLWFLGYVGLIFKSFVMIIAAILCGVIGAIILLIGVFRDRIKEKEEEKDNDYSKY